ncbi:MAG: thermonuclease family protein [Candidatus Margulisiibacteriota bacterium]
MKVILFLIVLVIHGFSITQSVLVTRVVDGDNNHFKDYKGKKKKVRLWGIDAPELTQRDGAKSGRFLSILISGSYVTLNVIETDRYGRWVAQVFDEQNRYLNEEMVRLGLAWVYDSYVGDQVPEWFEYQRQAQAKQIGLWRIKSPVPPWEYRRKTYSK